MMLDRITRSLKQFASESPPGIRETWRNVVEILSSEFFWRVLISLSGNQAYVHGPYVHEKLPDMVLYASDFDESGVDRKRVKFQIDRHQNQLQPTYIAHYRPFCVIMLSTHLGWDRYWCRSIGNFTRFRSKPLSPKSEVCNIISGQFSCTYGTMHAGYLIHKNIQTTAIGERNVGFGSVWI